jgi:hypothetical protein
MSYSVEKQSINEAKNKSNVLSLDVYTAAIAQIVVVRLLTPYG